MSEGATIASAASSSTTGAGSTLFVIGWIGATGSGVIGGGVGEISASGVGSPMELRESERAPLRESKRLSPSSPCTPSLEERVNSGVATGGASSLVSIGAVVSCDRAVSGVGLSFSSGVLSSKIFF